MAVHPSPVHRPVFSGANAWMVAALSAAAITLLSAAVLAGREADRDRPSGLPTGSATGPDQDALDYIEIDVTSAIARLMRDTSGTVCFTAGHGERSPDDTGSQGLSQAGEIARSNGYAIRTVDLLASPDATAGCDALVVAAPASSLSDAATEAVTAYLRQSGKAIVAGDPGSAADPTPLVRP